jgi:hypothetical protein
MERRPGRSAEAKALLQTLVAASASSGRLRSGEGLSFRQIRGFIVKNREGKDQNDDQQQPGQGHLQSNDAAVHDRNHLHQVCSHCYERRAIGRPAVCAAPEARLTRAGPLGERAPGGLRRG